MTRLTSSLLDNFPYEQVASDITITRGYNYFKDNRVVDIEMSADNKAVCSVLGDSGDYSVIIEVDKKSDQLTFDCDCPYAELHFCKHMIAASLELSDYLKRGEHHGYEEEEEDEKTNPLSLSPQAGRQWEDNLESVFMQIPQAGGSGNHAQRYALFMLMEKSGYHFSTDYSFTPCVVKARNWPIITEVIPEDSESVNKLLDENREWKHFIEEMSFRANPDACVNLSPEAINHILLLLKYTRYFGYSNLVDKYLSIIKQYKIPIFLGNKYKHTIRERITIQPDPVEPKVFFTQSNGSLLLQLGLQGKDIPFETQDVKIVSDNPPWFLIDQTLYLASDPGYFPLIFSLPVSIPEKDVDYFRDQYLIRIAQSLPVAGNLIQWQDIDVEPVPRLYLHDDKENSLGAEIRFGYGEHEVNASRDCPAQSVEVIEGTWNLARIHRQPEREQVFYQMLTEPNFRLKRADSSHPYGSFMLRARAHPFDFLLYSIPQLTAAGFEIYGEENLKAGKVNRSTPSLHVNITSGIDWFDLQAMVQFGDQQIDLKDVRKVFKRGGRYVMLADGTIGHLPEEWLEKYKHLWGLARETEKGFRVNDFHLPLVDALLEEGVADQIPPELSQRREQLRNFEKIVSQPLPQGFSGELYPYQKHGFDWLHFLHHYHFGGILADDMGLGKTVQMLTYLLSLKEKDLADPARRTTRRTASLLVVPKTLITNWQRESNKFTPDLRFLEYLGNFRNKDITIFNDYDVILTTYGTMLRDIELLRRYKFDHVILDESQAIKNPLAKSAKAARLLDASHRLVMTGTPVENNTFELWSQFAFINPGLLGSMEYFKKSFATPIENGKGEEALATLRKLTYPFILRRTKEQVAPELPPCTERTIFTDMDTAQIKLYSRTKDYYRAELLGLIEEQGINDARFKILEGLLRLRQIAIHPRLVDPGYRGDSPKFEVLLETLETLQNENHKALIFSQFVEILHLVRRELDERKFRYEYLDGKTHNRQAHVDSFQNDPSIPFFLISLKAGGVGLNLTAADYVIHLDPWWNPAVEMQASDRAHRIGQDKPVFVYKIITRDTVEEKILKLQEKKKDLVKNLITSETSFFKSLTQDEVRTLFE